MWGLTCPALICLTPVQGQKRNGAALKVIGCFTTSRSVSHNLTSAEGKACGGQPKVTSGIRPVC